MFQHGAMEADDLGYFPSMCTQNNLPHAWQCYTIEGINHHIDVAVCKVYESTN